MEKIEFNNDTYPAISKETLEAMQDNIEDAIETGKILYDNPLGCTSDVTLNESVANFDYICIVVVGTNTEKTIRIDDADNKSIYETLEYASGNNHVVIFSRFVINQNKISVITANCGYYTIDYLNSNVKMNLDRKNYIYIKKVIGYRRG